MLWQESHPSSDWTISSTWAQKMNDEIAAEAPWVSVEGPGPGDAEFLERWLLAAVEADHALQEQFRKNPGLRQQISRLEVLCLVEFSPAVTKCVELLMENLTCFSLDLWDEWGEIFTVMAELGFFRLTGDRYQMTIPREVTGSRIESALLRLAATEDVHHEELVTCLTKPEAQKWQLRLERLPWMQRVADRDFLIEDI